MAPFSTFDFKIHSGRQIPIEERGKEEVLRFGNIPTAPAKSKAYNPAFDVTDAKLISAFVTEAGIIRPPYKKNINKKFKDFGGVRV